MLEHTDAPDRAIQELARVLRVDGLLVLTTPNRVWQGVVRAASRLRLRPFRGLENWRTSSRGAGWSGRARRLAWRSSSISAFIHGRFISA